MTNRNKFTALIATCLLAAAGSANASWIQVSDPNLADLANNPGFGPNGPGNQSAATVGVWLQDLLDAPSVPTLLGFENTFSAGSITGLASSGSLYVTLHYGNYAVNDVKQNDVTVAWGCTTACSIFTGYTTQGLSNYRYYGTTTTVPEPAILSLMGMGLAGIGLMRRRRRI